MRPRPGAAARAAASLLVPLLVPLVAALAGAPDPARAQPAPPAPGADTAAAAGLRVSLLTFGQGDLVWEKFGHNAIRIVDEARAVDVAYNWGVFDFRQPGFLRRFLVGDPLYSTEGWPGRAMIEAYAQDDRAVWEQDLALTAAERLALRDFVEWNAREEHKHYRYDYFRDNCSTRVRDALDRALGGALARATADTTALTYRGESLRLNAGEPLPYVGIDVALGAPADRPLTRWEASFIPMRLQEYVRTVRVRDGAGGTRALVAAERQLYAPRRAAEPAAPPRRVGWFLLLGVALAAGVALLGHRAARGGAAARRALAGAGAAWGVVAGLLGVAITLAWAATRHDFWDRNENLFQLSPVALSLAVLLPLALRARASDLQRRAAGRATLALAALSVAGFALQALPGLDQVNGNVVALALPVHLALAWSVRRAAGRPAAGGSPP